MSSKNERGFAHIAIALVIILVAATGGSGYYVWHKNHAKSQATKTSLQTQSNSGNQTSANVTTYDACVKAPGSIQLETSPPVCKTKDGKSFTQSTSYLSIKQWNVRLPLASTIQDAYYEQTSDGIMHVSTRTLQVLAAELTGCKTGIDDLYLSRSTSVPPDQYAWPPKLIHGYYYYPSNVIEPECIIQGSSPVIAQIQAIQKTLASSMKNVVEESASTQPAPKSSSIIDYDQCVKAPGSVQLQTYPVVCETSDGKSFTQ